MTLRDIAPTWQTAMRRLRGARGGVPDRVGRDKGYDKRAVDAFSRSARAAFEAADAPTPG